MIAFCEEAGQVRTFKCERIQSSQPVEGEYAIPADFSLEEHWSRGEEAFKSARKTEEFYPVTIRVHKADAGLLSRLEVLEMAEEGERLIAKVNLYSYERACADLPGLIWHAEIIEPPLLREHVKDKLILLGHIYN